MTTNRKYINDVKPTIDNLGVTTGRYAWFPREQRNKKHIALALHIETNNNNVRIINEPTEKEIPPKKKLKGEWDLKE